jgi:hypothetical protein
MRRGTSAVRGAHQLARAAVAGVVVVILGACDAVTSAAQRAGVVPTFEQHCAKALPPTRIAVAAVPVTYATDESRPYAELTRMGVEAGEGERVIGLTRARISHTASIVVAGIEDPRSKEVCVRPEIDVRLSMVPMTVYVGREFRDHECKRDAIMEHERKHVAVYRDYLAEVVVEVRDEITRAYGNVVMHFPGRDQAQREIETALTGYLDPILQRSTRELKLRQAEVDTPAEYARVAAACGGIAVFE